jgi:hypothetical protein
MKHRFKTLSATCHAVASERKRELLETAVQTAAAEARRADIFVENGISINPKLRQERYILLSHRTLTMSLLTELGKFFPVVSTNMSHLAALISAAFGQWRCHHESDLRLL